MIRGCMQGPAIPNQPALARFQIVLLVIRVHKKLSKFDNDYTSIIISRSLLYEIIGSREYLCSSNRFITALNITFILTCNLYYVLRAVHDNAWRFNMSHVVDMAEVFLNSHLGGIDLSFLSYGVCLPVIILYWINSEEAWEHSLFSSYSLAPLNMWKLIKINLSLLTLSMLNIYISVHLMNGLYIHSISIKLFYFYMLEFAS